MISLPLWLTFLLMLPVVFVTALVSCFFRHEKVTPALREALRLTVYITLGILGLSAMAFALHYLFAGGVVWN